MAQEEIFDSPVNWVADHTRRYLETNGQDGHIWNGATTLLITMRGRHSGKLRRTALIYGRDGDNYVVVASKGGSDQHPSWYLNLVKTPTVDVQVAGERFQARACTASAEEKKRLWPTMIEVWPAYNEYQAQTRRDIPVVILERV